jgi:uncharacterized membrane protein YidH (DUF202 family)
MRLDYYNSTAAAEEARRRAHRRRALERGWWIWYRWHWQLERYRHPAEPRQHSIAFVTVWGGVVVVVIVFVLMMIADNPGTLSRWIGYLF